MQGVDLGLGLRARLFENGSPFFVDPFEAAGELGFHFDGVGADGLGQRTLFPRQVVLAVYFVQQFFGFEIGSGHHRARFVNDRAVEAEPFGNGKRIRAARQADGEAIRGRERLQIKFHAGVGDSRRGVGVHFKFGVVRGGERGHALIEQIRKDGAGDGRAFGRVGAGAEFVEDDERARVGLLQNFDDVGDVRRKSGQALLDGLFVADVGVDAVEE